MLRVTFGYSCLQAVGRWRNVIWRGETQPYTSICNLRRIFTPRHQKALREAHYTPVLDTLKSIKPPTLAMFSRRFPHVGNQISSRLIQAQHHPQIQTFAKLPLRARIPAQQCTKRREGSTLASAKKLYQENPFTFPLAVAWY